MKPIEEITFLLKSSILIVSILLSTNSFSQVTIVSQSFDFGASGYSDDLNYAISSATYVQINNTTAESSPNALRFTNNNGSNNSNFHK